MSKTIITLAHLQDALDSERVWRVKELSTIRKKLLPTKDRLRNNTKEEELAHLRPCITMIYAHWEGFVKAACDTYLHFVAMQRVPYSKMRAPFLALAARKYVADSGEKGARADRVIAKFYTEDINLRAFLPYKKGIDTKSNLWFEVFQEIYESLGLSWKAYELKSNLIDMKLVGKRNAIAHGRYIDVKQEDVEELFDGVIELMDNIKDQILDAAASKNYLLHSQENFESTN